MGVTSDSPYMMTDSRPVSRLGSPGRAVKLPSPKGRLEASQAQFNQQKNLPAARPSLPSNMMNMQLMDSLVGGGYNPIEEATNHIQSLTESLERETDNSKVVCF